MPAAILGIALGVIASITTILLSRIRLVITFKGGNLVIYKRILFFKKRIYPNSRKRKDSFEVLKQTAKEIFKSEDPELVSKMIFALNEFFTTVIFDVLNKLNIKIVKIHASIGTENAATTAIAHSFAVQSVSYFIGFLDNHSNVDLSRYSDIQITPDFTSRKSWANIKCIIQLHLITALFLRIESIITLFRIENIGEILSEVIKNGTVKTKRNDQIRP